MTPKTPAEIDAEYQAEMERLRKVSAAAWDKSPETTQDGQDDKFLLLVQYPEMEQ